MLAKETEAAITTGVEDSQLHGRANADHSTQNVDSTHVEKFTCKDCGESFTRAEAAKPSTPHPGTCAKCYKKNRAEAKEERKVEAVRAKKVGKSDRCTFTLDQYTSIAIDTLAVGKDRSTVVEQAIALMLANDPAAKAYVEHKASKLQE